MDFALPPSVADEADRFDAFLDRELTPNLTTWTTEGAVPRSFFVALGDEGFLAIERQSALVQVCLLDRLARRSPGVAVAVLVQQSLGGLGLHRFANDGQRSRWLAPALRGRTLVCVGNTENTAGSDVAAVSMTAVPVDGGYRLDGAKAYVTNGALADYALVTAVTDPDAPRSRRHSMFVVDLTLPGVRRKPLNKDVWIPADLTRLSFDGVVVPADHLLGEPGRGMTQILEIFTNSRVTITGLTVGTAQGAFDLAMRHGQRRRIFGQRLIDFQAKSFEAADLWARLEAARLVLYRAAWSKDEGRDFRLDSSMAKYLAVDIARHVATWSADLHGAASVVRDHPVHKFPLDAWAASLGEGTQDVHKLVIARGLLERYA